MGNISYRPSGGSGTSGVSASYVQSQLSGYATQAALDAVADNAITEAQVQALIAAAPGGSVVISDIERLEDGTLRVTYSDNTTTIVARDTVVSGTPVVKLDAGLTVPADADPGTLYVSPVI